MICSAISTARSGITYRRLIGDWPEAVRVWIVSNFNHVTYLFA
jgi:hypothetical protein